jgi:mannose-6-phosphate isomerase-like protein (cupin superfamily)
MFNETNHIEVIGPRAGEVVDVLGAPIAIKSSGRADQLFFADHPVPVGYAVPMHVHEREDELFYVLEGRLTLDTAQGEIEAGPGAFVHLPRGVAHGFRNPGPAAARMLVVTTPGGDLEGVFRGLDAAARDPARPLDGERIGAVCGANRIGML